MNTFTTANMPGLGLCDIARAATILSQQGFQAADEIRLGTAQLRTNAPVKVAHAALELARALNDMPL